MVIAVLQKAPAAPVWLRRVENFTVRAVVLSLDAFGVLLVLHVQAP